MNYGTASAITDTSCMRLQLIETSFGGNEFTRLTRTVRWKSNSQGVDWQPTRGVGSRRRAVPSRHPFLFYARNQNMCAHWPSSMQVHGETVRAKRTYTLTLPERPTCRPRSRQLQSLCLAQSMASSMSTVSLLSTPMQKLPPATPWTVWAVSSHRPLPRTVGTLAPVAPYLFLPLSHPFSTLSSLSLFSPLLSLLLHRIRLPHPSSSPLLLPPSRDLRRPSLPGWRGCSLASDYSLRFAMVCSSTRFTRCILSSHRQGV